MARPKAARKRGLDNTPRSIQRGDELRRLHRRAERARPTGSPTTLISTSANLLPGSTRCSSDERRSRRCGRWEGAAGHGRG